MLVNIFNMASDRLVAQVGQSLQTNTDFDTGISN